MAVALTGGLLLAQPIGFRQIGLAQGGGFFHTNSSAPSAQLISSSLIRIAEFTRFTRFDGGRSKKTEPGEDDDRDLPGKLFFDLSLPPSIVRP